MPKSNTNIVTLSVLSLLASVSAYTTVGCYTSPGQLTSTGSYQFQSQGYCQEVCTKHNQPIFALHNGNECYCGDQLPPSEAKVSPSQCQTPCSGFPSEYCGTTTTWLVNNSTLTLTTTDNTDINLNTNPSNNKRDTTTNTENGIVIAPDSDDTSSTSPDTMKVNPTIVETGIAMASSPADVPKTAAPSVTATSMVVAASASASASVTASGSGSASSGAVVSPSASVGAAPGLGSGFGGVVGGMVLSVVMGLGL